MKKKLIIGTGLIGIILFLAIVIVVVMAITNRGSLRSNSQNEKGEKNSYEVDNILANSKNNQFDAALMGVSELLTKNPNDIDLLLLKANILLSKGSAQFLEKEYALRAQVVLEKVFKIDSNNAEAFRLMGYSYEIQNLFNKALVNYNKSLAIMETPEAYNWKGHTYDLMGDIFKAEEFYKKAVDLKGGYQMALRNLSRVYLRLDKKDEARDILKQLIKMPVDNISLVAGDYHSLGTIEFDDKNIDKAKKLFDKALEIDPSFMLAKVEIAKYKILFEGKKDEAILLLNKVVEEYPKQIAPREWLGFAYLENNEFNKSIETLNKAIGLIPGDITLMGEQRTLIRSRLNYYLSMDYSLNGDAEKAKEHLLKIMEGTDKTTIIMLTTSLQKGIDGPYKNLMSDPDISSLAEKLNSINK